MDAVAEAAERGLALDPANPGFHFLAGIAAGHQAENKLPEGPIRQRRFREADRLLAEAVRMDPTNAEFRRLRKNNARDSRLDFMAKLTTGWLFGVVIGVVVLPIAVRGVAVPCWCWVVLPLAVWFLAVLCYAVYAEFTLVVPLGWFDVVTVPLLPEERRRGRVLWLVFLTATAAALFLPILLMSVDPHTPDTKPTRRDGGFRLLSPTTGKTHGR